MFHGAESDVKWLQRDFSIYVVNLFDTFLAAKQLRPPPAAFSLAHLLQVRVCVNVIVYLLLVDAFLWVHPYACTNSRCIISD